MEKKKIALGTLMIGIGIAGTAQGAVYIAPPDIDQYKQKTDQSFYDLYQNPNGPLKVNPNATPYLNQFSTDQRPLKGYVLPSVRGGVVQGAHLPPNTKALVNIAGVTFEVRVGNDGQVSLRRVGGNGKAVIRNGFAEVEETLGTSCASSGKYGCTTQDLRKRTIYFNAVSGDYMVREYTTRQDRSCGKYGCSDWGAERFVALTNVDKGTIDMATVLKKGRYHQVASGTKGFVTAYAKLDEESLIKGLNAVGETKRDGYGKYGTTGGTPGYSNPSYGNSKQNGKFF